MKVLVFGTFDLLHPGHLFVLNQASKRGDLCVVVARDVTVEKIKGFKPKQSELARQTAILAVYPQATVVLGSTNSYREPLEAIQPELILLGYDQRLPPGITEADFNCPVERLDSFEPEIHKSSLLRN